MSQPSYMDPQHRPAAAAGQVDGTNVMAILSLVFAFVASPVGIVFGHIAKRQIRRTGQQGNGLATAGLVLSYIFTIIGIAWVIFVVVAVANSSGTT
jgi:large-conductance mechanosensitive channel